jgi:hypothetical protein
MLSCLVPSAATAEQIHQDRAVLAVPALPWNELQDTRLLRMQGAQNARFDPCCPVPHSDLPRSQEVNGVRHLLSDFSVICGGQSHV